MLNLAPRQSQHNIMYQSTVCLLVTCVTMAVLMANTARASPLETLLTEYLEAGAGTKLTADAVDADYDLHYDQRQSGSENYRLNVDGVMMTVPAASESTLGSLSAMATNYLLDLAAATSELDGDDDDDGYGGGGDSVDEVEGEEEAEQSASADHGGPHEHPEPQQPQPLLSKTDADRPYTYDRMVVEPIRSVANKASRVRRPSAGGLAAIVAQSRNNPGNGPAKKRNK